jgi:hypothetical protein
MHSPLIQAQGFLQLNLFNSVYLTGSVAFVLGPTQNVTLTDGTMKNVTTMTIGAANVDAFIGANGPYWTDTNHDHQVDESEKSTTAIGFHITDFDVGLMVMAATDPHNPGVYLAAKASVDSFGLVGIDKLTATGMFDLAFNVGIGASGIGVDLAVVNFDATFSEQLKLFDTNHDGTITVGELRALSGQTSFAGLYSSGDAITVTISLETLLTALDTNNDHFLEVSEAKALLSSGNQGLADTADADADGRLHGDGGFEVNTGDPTSPVVLDFNQFFISLQLGGIITAYTDSAHTNPVLRLNGLFLFEADSSNLKRSSPRAWSSAPTSPSNAKFFDMNALGGLVINSAGIAADINISVELGTGLMSSFAFGAGAKARLVFSTTGVDQTSTIRSAASVPDRHRQPGQLVSRRRAGEQGGANIAALGGLTGSLDSRFTVNDDGSATFTIFGIAPKMADLFPDANIPSGGPIEGAGAYFAVGISAHLTLGVFTLEGGLGLIITQTGLQMSAEAR